MSHEILAKLITDNLGLIYSFAIRLSRKHADDIVQQACIGIMRSRTFDPEISTATFLHWQVRGAFTHLKRREWRLAQARDLVPIQRERVPDQEAVVDLKMVRERIERLPPRQRRAVTLLLTDHNYIEIGKEMGISHQAAQQLVKRARPALGVAA